MSPNPTGSRAQRVAKALHAEGTIGLTVAQIARVCELKPSDAKQVCRQLQREGLAILLSTRKSAETDFKLEEVYGCRCKLDHRTDRDPSPVWRTLTETEKERGLAGVAAARAALEAAVQRKAS